MQKEMFSKSRKAQITLFVVLAIVIIGAVAGYFILKQSSEEIISQEFISAKAQIDSCLNTVLLDSIYTIGLQGGYFTVPEPKVSYILSDIPIYYSAKTNEVTMPSETELEKQIALAVKDSSYLCAETFTNLENQNYNPQIGNIGTVKVTINNNTVEATVNWPITLSQNEKTQLITKYSALANFDLNNKYNNINEFIEAQKEYPNEILVEKLLSTGVSNGFNIETIDLGDSVTLYTFIYNNEIYNNATFIYAFGVEYE